MLLGSVVNLENVLNTEKHKIIHIVFTNVYIYIMNIALTLRAIVCTKQTKLKLIKAFYISNILLSILLFCLVFVFVE